MTEEERGGTGTCHLAITIIAMDGKWETVVDKKKQHRKQEQGKQPSGQAGSGDATQSAFASLDAWKRPGTTSFLALFL